jgi:hypothetical protein
LGEFLLELIAGLIREMIPSFLKNIGASTKWLISRRKKTYHEILEEEWNTRIGILLVFFLVLLIIQILK